VRPAQQLLADVGEFMTLAPGDVLMLGCDASRPRARVGDRIEISMPALGRLANALVAEAV
jgi:5-oxopent-3-ene-1,2,5-tricarboxylate decarboxylase/2-hydroxyhepta-2,4-diene-1,7-dioate isomerase